jgi:hypothetical protein
LGVLAVSFFFGKLVLLQPSFQKPKTASPDDVLSPVERTGAETPCFARSLSVREAVVGFLNSVANRLSICSKAAVKMGCGGSRGMAPGDLPDRHSAGVRVGSVRKKNVPALDIGKNKNSNDRKAVREHSFVTLNSVRDPDELAFEGAANITMATSLKRLLGDGRAYVTLTADRTLPYMSLTKHDENSKSETTEIACKYVTLFHVACAFNNHK